MRLFSLLELLFEDKRATVTLVLLWGFMTVGMFWNLGAFHIQFMTFGPSPETKFMGMVIDTWDKWLGLAIFSFCNTAINEFLSNALIPWFTNTIQDHKTKYIPYNKLTCLGISQAHTIYCHVIGSLSLMMFFCQVDFLLVRLVADLVVNQYSTMRFLSNKVVDKEQYSRDRDSGPPLLPVSSKTVDLHNSEDEQDSRHFLSVPCSV